VIFFNKPVLFGKEVEYIAQCVAMGKTAGDGLFTKKCHSFFEQKYGFNKVLLTTSCTDALEMCSILLDIKEGDEVIIPSYTFVSTANAFALRGAKIIFADSGENNPNIDAERIEELITEHTKAIIVVHYAGVSADMDVIMEIAKKHNLFVIEDAAQAVDAYYKGRPLGSIGHLAAFSFHETKNISCGEGGMLVVNDDRFIKRAEIIREKGTNRAAFFRGEVNKYSWVDIGSSFLPSDITAAVLYAQLENMDKIQQRRKEIWDIYYAKLAPLGKQGAFSCPDVPTYATNNYHMFYIVCNSLDERTRLIEYLKRYNISSVFHYLSLHTSDYFRSKHDGRELPNSDHFSDCLLRLPMYYELTDEDVREIVRRITEFYNAM
jgi:dTDP-4-amino-4,6-dideoxygalactose transaminase